MSRTIRARFRHGVIESFESIDFPKGKEVTITILNVPSEPDVDASRRAAAWKGTLDAEALIQNIYADRLISTRAEPRL